MDERDVVVVGGGLAGITAALRLADAGRSVTLLEARPRLGGAAFSFRRGELSIDNGQHVFLRCCTAYRDLLARLGVADQVTLQRHLDIPILRADGRQRPAAPHARRAGAAAPVGVAGRLRPAQLARSGCGSVGARWRCGCSTRPTRRSTQQTLGDFLRRHGQNDAIIAALWGIVATATLNLDPDEASLALAAKVFRTGMLDHAPAADVGYAAVPLGELHSTRGAGRARRPPASRCCVNHRATRDRAGPGRGQRTRGDVARVAGRPTRSCWPRPTRGVRRRCPRCATTAAAPRRRARRDARSSTCTWSTTAGSPTCRSRPRSTRPSSGSSTAPTPPGCAAPTRTGSTWRSPCRPPTA